MLVVAQLVFLTPRAALVGLAFAVPLITLATPREGVLRESARSSVFIRRVAPACSPAVGLVGLAALVAATAAQPAVRDTDSTPVRSDAELLLTFDVSRSMLATAAPGGVDGWSGRARSGGRPRGASRRSDRCRDADEPDDAAPLPDGDARGVTAVIDHSLRIMQPPPERLTAARASSLAALSLAADRSYYNPSARKRVLVVFSDLDSDFFSLDGTLRLLRQHRIEPFLVRVAGRESGSSTAPAIQTRTSRKAP